MWYGVDPLQEKYPGISTYAYCANNPIIYIDPDGRGPKSLPPLPFFTTLQGLKALGDKVADKVVGILNYTDLQDLFVLGSAIVSVFTGNEPQQFDAGYKDGKITIETKPATGEDIEAAKNGLLLFGVSGSSVNKASNAVGNAASDAMRAGRKVVAGAEAAKLAKDTDKMLTKDIDKVLGKGWHDSGSTAKKEYLKTYQKELRGNTNADFYVDKNNGDIFLKGNQPNNQVWVKTKDNIHDF